MRENSKIMLSFGSKKQNASEGNACKQSTFTYSLECCEHAQQCANRKDNQRIKIQAQCVAGHL